MSDPKRKARKRRASWLGKALLLLLSTAGCLLLAEGALRIADGYKLSDLLLERPFEKRPPGDLDDPIFARAAEYVAGLPAAAGMDRAWFLQSPPPALRKEPLAEMRQRYTAAGRRSREAIYAFNRNYAIERVCKGQYLLDPWLQDSVPDRFIFEPTPDPARPYRYRLLAGQTSPEGYVVNRWGFRGADIPLNRPPRTIRIAFAGASTTINAPTLEYSYPEYVGYWLNLWAQATGLDVRFDVINSGRQGFRSGEIAALVRFEVLPFEPDLVVYYEGSNQFYPNRYVKYPDGQKPRQPRFTLPLESWIEQRSALARRVAALFWSLRSGEEPPKNMGTVEWPKELNEVHPELSKRSLFPSQLGTIVDDLDYLRKHLAADGSELILSTFVWMVEDGMVLKLPEQTDLYQYLNVTFWPFTYAHMRRYADFQNRVLTEYARQNSIELLDIAAVFPRESSLFYDAIHMPEAGLRLRAWITTQMLIPAIEQRLASGRLPRPPRAEPLQEHPILSAPPTRVTLEELRSECR